MGYFWVAWFYLWRLNMIYEGGGWKRYRDLPGVYEVDFHWSDHGPREMDYGDAMEEVHRTALNALKKAHADPSINYVLFTHGWSTSGPFKITARSVVRGLMRSKESTPYIVKAKSIQHESVFVAAIKK